MFTLLAECYRRTPLYKLFDSNQALRRWNTCDGHVGRNKPSCLHLGQNSTCQWDSTVSCVYGLWPTFTIPRTAADVETLSRDVSATKTQSAAVTEGASRDSVAVGNERSPVEEDENYESCQENISIDTLLQEKHHLAVETLPGPDTDEDDNSVESGGKRVRKKSQKIRGVYTPDARLKGLFMSEKKTECMPLPKTSRAIFKKFSDILSENLVQ